MIVVDTNVISYLFLRGERSESIDRLYSRDGDWIAPRLWIDEFLNVLATHERLERLGPGDAVSILNDALALLEGGTYEVPPERVLSVARRTSCSAYDSQFISLAEDRGLKLFTCDQRILKACPKIAVEPN